ncbi:GGDEF domain-containing response regulator [Lacrimispora sp.]|uniref:GGDEF domain-containing response regulator n=1 Tax=Lacrimispora sp. TaxID=2719234 RepID=UPI0028ABB7B4|nr:diguanylate cyclase [Lacrimispora sp.]
MESGTIYKILIVEDGKVSQKVLVDTLQETYNVRVVSTGKEAIQMAKQFRPHLILLDIILPDTSGFDVLKDLKGTKSTQNIPIIVITGLDNDNDEEKALCLGAVDYVRKPFNKVLVNARVRIHIKIVEQLLTIEKLSFYDALTDLANRRKFDYHMEYEWQRALRKKTTIGLLLMDLDNFKNYNDTYGHRQGDAMLKAVAGVLKKTLNQTTILPCRWGGEEFAVLVPETSLEKLSLIAENIRSTIETMEVPRNNANGITRITASISAISANPYQRGQLEGFIESADRLLYQAKKEGRNRVCL